jgi:hypothetical protein
VPSSNPARACHREIAGVEALIGFAPSNFAVNTTTSTRGSCHLGFVSRHNPHLLDISLLFISADESCEVTTRKKTTTEALSGPVLIHEP